MRQLLITLALAPLLACQQDFQQERAGRNLSVFNVVSFPNSVCGATNGFNGTCYTASECTTLGGTASGTCASSFGVCCVFSIACGANTNANNSYAIMDTFSISTDKDPCTYTICRTNTDVCKLRIDFDTMVLSPPAGISATAVATDSITVGDCNTDSLTVTNPGGSVPPTICGYNTGQHMYVPASSQCNEVKIDIDTGSTTTTRKWQIKITQYACGNLMAPEQDCLQYHTEASGTIASFNWDTSTTAVAATQYHLSSQYYDICIRRARKYCSICFSPQSGLPAIAGTAASYGVSSGSDDATQTNAIGSLCTGVNVINPAPATATDNTGLGDYLDIVALQSGTGTKATLNTNRICGVLFNAAAAPQTTHATACSWAVPFKVGVHFDDADSIIAGGDAGTAGTAGAAMASGENDIGAISAAGYGYSGFHLAYWQNSC